MLAWSSAASAASVLEAKVTSAAGSLEEQAEKPRTALIKSAAELLLKVEWFGF
jgi:hypothetical protein